VIIIHRSMLPRYWNPFGSYLKNYVFLVLCASSCTILDWDIIYIFILVSVVIRGCAQGCLNVRDFTKILE
jgi:hypothetical protein